MAPAKQDDNPNDALGLISELRDASAEQTDAGGQLAETPSEMQTVTQNPLK